MTMDITARARKWLGEQPVTLRGSPRHGCCGGRAVVPVAEARVPDNPSGYRQVACQGVTVYLQPGLLTEAWTIDVEGLGPWKRLVIEGAESLSGQHKEI